MAAILEREIKLRFPQVDTARTAVLAAGATPLRGRRLQEDSLLDSMEDGLRTRRCVLRVRVESGKSYVTFKGPVQPSMMKLRGRTRNDGGRRSASHPHPRRARVPRVVPLRKIPRGVRARRCGRRGRGRSIDDQSECCPRPRPEGYQLEYEALCRLQVALGRGPSSLRCSELRVNGAAVSPMLDTIRRSSTGTAWPTSTVITWTLSVLCATAC